MNKLWKFLWIVSLIWAAAPALALERPEIHFDDRTWTIAFQGVRGDQLGIDFVPDGQTAQNWSEMLSTQFLIGMQDTLSVPDYVARAKQTISRQCPAVRWKAVRESPEEALYEWNVDACKGVEDQSELTRVLRGEEGLHVLRYVIKRSPLPAEKRTQWTRLLGETKLLKD